MTTACEQRAALYPARANETLSWNVPTEENGDAVNHQISRRKNCINNAWRVAASCGINGEQTLTFHFFVAQFENPKTIFVDVSAWSVARDGVRRSAVAVAVDSMDFLFLFVISCSEA